MKIMNSDVTICNASIECGLWAIERHLMRKYGTNTAENDIAPLRWYIDTGRATLYFMSRLFACKPYMIARRLHEGGSYDEAIARIKNYLMNNTDYNAEA